MKKKKKTDFPLSMNTKFKVEKYISEVENRGWQSFNWADWWTVEKLKN